jgi:hypothetical protein
LSPSMRLPGTGGSAVTVVSEPSAMADTISTYRAET